MLYSAPEAEPGSPPPRQQRSSHPFVRSAPSFRPDLRAVSAVARSGGQGWLVFGPPLQRRAASLTAASTTACSVASGARPPHTIKPQKAGMRAHQKTRSCSRRPAAHRAPRDDSWPKAADVGAKQVGSYLGYTGHQMQSSRQPRGPMGSIQSRLTLTVPRRCRDPAMLLRQPVKTSVQRY